MKKLLALVALATMFCGVSYADEKGFILPVDQHGMQAHPNWAGAKYYRLSGTSAETVAVAKPVVLLGVVMSSGAITQYLTLRDTAVADGLATRKVLDLMRFMPDTNIANNRIPFPIRFAQGLTAQVVGAADVEATLLYIEQTK